MTTCYEDECFDERDERDEAQPSTVVHDEEPDSKVRSRAWIFTWNNYPNLSDDQVLELWHQYFGKNLRYVSWSREIAPTTGTPHFQGFVYFNEAKVLGKPLINRYKNNPKLTDEENEERKREAQQYTKGSLKSFNKTIRWAIMRGSLAQSQWYCSKHGTQDLFEWGKKPADEGPGGGRGARTDLDSIAEAIASGEITTKEQIKEIRPALLIRCERGLESFLDFVRPHRDCRPIVYWICGPSGSGKSEFAEKRHGRENVYRKMNGGLFFNDYRYQQVVVIEEFSRLSPTNPRGWVFTELIQLIDKYEITSEVKGSFKKFDSPYIYFTSVKHPSEFFDDYEFPQILRRIDGILHAQLSRTSAGWEANYTLDKAYADKYFDPTRPEPAFNIPDEVNQRIEAQAKRREAAMKERALLTQMKCAKKALALKESRVTRPPVVQEDE